MDGYSISLRIHGRHRLWKNSSDAHIKSGGVGTLAIEGQDTPTPRLSRAVIISRDKDSHYVNYFKDCLARKAQWI